MDYEEEAEEIREEAPYFGVPQMKESLESDVIEERLRSRPNTFLALAIGIVAVVGVLIGIRYFELSLFQVIIVALVALIVYTIILFFLLEPSEIIKEIEKPVYVEAPKKKLNIPKYKYLGSSETKTYHKRSCRFSKLIKRKFKVSANTMSYFQMRGYHKCNLCLGKKSRK